ncbi:MAG: serine aminopeptidase domain-containing protein [Pseudolabrys sp.]
MARAGRTAYAFDQRGHGDSDWGETGAYRFHDYARDVRTIARTLGERTATNRWRSAPRSAASARCWRKARPR